MAMNLCKACWSDENIRLQNRQQDFYLTEGGYKLKKRYLQTLRNLNDSKDKKLISFLCHNDNRKLLADNYKAILEGSTGDEYNKLNAFLCHNGDEKLDRIEKEKSNIIRCIHNSLMKKYSEVRKGLHDVDGIFSEQLENASNLKVNPDERDKSNLKTKFESEFGDLQNNSDLEFKTNDETITYDKSKENDKEHVKRSKNNLQQQPSRNTDEKTNLKSNKSNNHNNNVNYPENEINAYIMSHPSNFAQQHVTCEHTMHNNNHDTDSTPHQNVPYNPHLSRELYFPPGSSHNHKNHDTMDESNNANILNNIAFIMNRFKTRYIGSSRYSECGSSKEILMYLYNNFLDQENCDFIVKTKSGDILSHQLVIAAFSPSVDSYLKSQKNKIQQPLMVSLEDCSLESVSNVLNFLYTNDITLNSLNIGFIANVSVRLDIPVLNHVSNDYLIQTLNTDNAFLHLSVSINNKFLSAVHIFKFIAINFFNLIEHEHLLLLPFENFYTLITHPSLHAKEVEVFISVTSWINFNRSSRMKHARTLLALIKFRLIDAHQLAKYVEKQEWVFNDDENKRIILDAYKFHALNKTRKETSKFD